jgi:flagellar basal-body rod modification protein FlgD
MTINTDTNTSATSTIANGVATAAKKSANQLGVSDFLTLMTTQLKNQDPLKPLDSTDFVAQLAQFGTVSGIQAMQTNISQLSDALRSSQALGGATLVGHDVLAPAADFQLGTTDTVSGALDLPQGTTSVDLTVEDTAGQVIRHIQMPAGSGLTQFSWDGLADSGERAAVGTYTIKANASVAGQQGSLDPMLVSRVNSVTLDSSGVGLTLNTSTLGSIALSDVRQVM